MTRVKAKSQDRFEIRKTPALRRQWPPAVIFFVLTLLTVLMAIGLKALVTGSIRF